jgi:hypothetical protein
MRFGRCGLQSLYIHHTWILSKSHCLSSVCDALPTPKSHITELRTIGTENEDKQEKGKRGQHSSRVRSQEILKLGE